MHDIYSWVSRSPYARALGILFEKANDAGVVLSLPHNVENENQSGALHGGVAASVAAMTSMAVARREPTTEAGLWHTATISISYLNAAIDVDLRAIGRQMRRGRDLVFVQSEIAVGSGPAISTAQSVVRECAGKRPASPLTAQEPPRARIVPPAARRVEENSFMAGRNIELTLQEDGQAVMRMGALESNANADGGLDEGAVLALMDSAGAMAAWSITGQGPYRASTPAIQAGFFGPIPLEDVVAVARVVHQDNETFWSDVLCSIVSTRVVVARATVLYRIVT